MNDLIGGRLVARAKATQSLAELYLKAQECAQLHADAGLPLPGEVQGLLAGGEEETKAGRNPPEPLRTRRDLSIVPSAPYPTPQKGWISVALKDAMPITVVPAAIRTVGEPLTLDDVHARVLELEYIITDSGIWRVVNKLCENGVLQRDALNRVFLPDDDRAANIGTAGRLWGPTSVFQPQEIARHRREAIVVLLRHFKVLGRAEIIDLLRRADWVQGSKHHSLVKGDLEALHEEGIVRRREDASRANLWDWELATEPKGRALKLA